VPANGGARCSPDATAREGDRWPPSSPAAHRSSAGRHLRYSPGRVPATGPSRCSPVESSRCLPMSGCSVNPLLSEGGQPLIMLLLDCSPKGSAGRAASCIEKSWSLHEAAPARWM
ncbi:hypothetical protein Dimus_026130, partial [Dionaea muscipula]